MLGDVVFFAPVSNSTSRSLFSTWELKIGLRDMGGKTVSPMDGWVFVR